MVILSRQVNTVRLPIYGEEITVQTSIFDCNVLDTGTLLCMVKTAYLAC